MGINFRGRITAYSSFKPLFYRVLKLVLPMAGARFINMLSGFIGMLLLAQLGSQVLAASTLLTAAMTTSIVLAFSILFSMGVVIGQAVGAKQYQTVGAITQQGCLLAVLIGIALMPLLWFMGDILRSLGQPPKLLPYIYQYFHVLAFGGVPILLSVATMQLYYAVNKQHIVILFSLFGLLVMTFFSYGLIFGHFGLPRCEVAGLAYAQIIQNTVLLLLAVGYACFHSDFDRYALLGRHSFQGFLHMRKLFSVGWPMSVQFGGELLAFFLIAVMIGWLGNIALAATQVVQQLRLLILVPIFSISEATGILVGQSVGAKKFSDILPLSIFSWLIVLTMIVVVGILVIVFPEGLARVYVKTKEQHYPEILHLIHLLFIIMPFTLMVDSTRSLLAGSLRGMLDTRFAMVTGLAAMWFIMIPLGYLLAFPAGQGVLGFRYAALIAFSLAITVLYRHWKKRLKSYL